MAIAASVQLDAGGIIGPNRRGRTTMAAATARYPP